MVWIYFSRIGTLTIMMGLNLFWVGTLQPSGLLLMLDTLFYLDIYRYFDTFVILGILEEPDTLICIEMISTFDTLQDFGVVL